MLKYAGETPLTSTGVWVYGHMVGGAYPTTSGLVTWCQQGLVDQSGVGSGGRRGFPIRYPSWQRVGR